MAAGPSDVPPNPSGRPPDAWAYIAFGGLMVVVGVIVIAARLADGRTRHVAFALMFLVLGGIGLAVQGVVGEAEQRTPLGRRSRAMLGLLVLAGVGSAVAAVALGDFDWSDVVFGGIWLLVGVALILAWRRAAPRSAGRPPTASPGA